MITDNLRTLIMPENLIKVKKKHVANGFLQPTGTGDCILEVF
jgi:hypothetical protein